MVAKIKKYSGHILMMFILLIIANPLQAGWPEEKKKIDYLISEVGKIKGTFIRNGTEHQPEEAVKHLKMKLRRGQNSWFAPSEEEWTAEMFIEKIATKSSFSGRAYKIKLKDGKIVTSKEWLYERLKKYKPGK